MQDGPRNESRNGGQKRAHFTYLYFRLLEYVSEIPRSDMAVDIALWEQDCTTLHFLAHMAKNTYPQRVATLSKRKGEVNFTAKLNAAPVLVATFDRA